MSKGLSNASKSFPSHGTVLPSLFNTSGCVGVSICRRPLSHHRTLWLWHSFAPLTSECSFTQGRLLPFHSPPELLSFVVAVQGQYFLPSGAPTTLSVIGGVFDENIKAAPVPAAAPAAQQQQQQQQGAGDEQDEKEQAVGSAIGPIGPTGPGMAEDADAEGLPAAAGGGSGGDQEGGSNQEAAAAAAEVEPVVGGETAGGGGGNGPVRRVVGPALPPAEVLAAAAAYHEGVEAAGGYDALYGGGEEEEESLVGPPPPDMVEEVDAVPQNEREGEVLRVMKVRGERGEKGGGRGLW